MSNNVMSQHQAVVLFTKQVLADRFQEGVDIRTYVTKADRLEIGHLITNGMLEGTVAISEKAKAKFGEKLRSAYVMGMITNWFKKSKYLNPNYKTEKNNEIEVAIASAS